MICKYLPISLTRDTLIEFNVKALIAVMAKEVFTVKDSYSFSEFRMDGNYETFIFLVDSDYSQQLFSKPNEYIEINTEEFKLGTLNTNNNQTNVFYHLDIIKNGITNNWERNFKFKDTIFYNSTCRVCLKECNKSQKLDKKELESNEKLTEISIWKYLHKNKMNPCDCKANNYDITFHKFWNGKIIDYCSHEDFKDDTKSSNGFLDLYVKKKQNTISVKFNKSENLNKLRFKKLLNSVEVVTRMLDEKLDIHSITTTKDDGHYNVLISFELSQKIDADNKSINMITSRVEKLSFIGFDPTDLRVVNTMIYNSLTDS